MAVKAKDTISLTRVNDGIPGRTYFIEASSNVLKRSKDNTISPNFIEFKAYYRDGNSAARIPYAGRFIIEETVDGNTWKTIYTSTANEDTVKHYLYSLLSTQTGQIVAAENGSIIGVPRDVTSVRCKLYASGGTTNLMDMQSVAVIRDADDNLTQEEVFNILTNNGTAQGIFMLNGQLYINMSYLQTGILKLGGVKNGNGQQDIYNNAGDLIGRIDNNGVTFFYEYQESGSGYSYKGVEFSKTGIRYVQEAIFTDDTAVTFETIPVIKFNSNQDGMDGNFDELDAENANVTNATIGNAILYNITKMLVSGDAKFSGKPEFSTGLNVIGGNVKFPGWGFNGRFIESLDGNVKLRDKDNIAQLDSKNFRIKYGLDLHLSGQTGSGDDFGDGGKPFNIHGLGTGTGSSIVISGSTVYRTSSSKRYKTIGRNITDEDIEKWYQIQPVWAKYKNEFVTRQSGCFNTVMPMLIAEDVETYIPKAAVKNENGETEDWSERVLIPAMFAMIKSQKNQIDELKRELEIIRKRSK